MSLHLYVNVYVNVNTYSVCLLKKSQPVFYSHLLLWYLLFAEQTEIKSGTVYERFKS